MYWRGRPWCTHVCLGAPADMQPDHGYGVHRPVSVSYFCILLCIKQGFLSAILRPSRLTRLWIELCIRSRIGKCWLFGGCTCIYAWHDLILAYFPRSERRSLSHQHGATQAVEQCKGLSADTNKCRERCIAVCNAALQTALCPLPLVHLAVTADDAWQLHGKHIIPASASRHSSIMSS